MKFVNVFVVLVSAVAIVMLSLLIHPANNAVAAQEGQITESFNVSVTGEASVYLNPNKVIVNLGVETLSKTAKESQERNAEIMNDVLAALEQAGISREQIKTTHYSLYADYDWSNGDRVFKGYKTRHYIQVSSKNIDKAGSIVDAASSAGANYIGDIQFTLTDEAMLEAKKAAIAIATNNSKEKAMAIARTFGNYRIVPVKLSLSSYSPYPIYKGAIGNYMESERSASTQIYSGDIRVSATVQALYKAIPS
ncbi:hypothetical protein DRN74_01820 [Candidatus Micrarchaeota archaeon]|nr:MAG: hypothetical protein DRN74_01820 [Candidatus Micrarchaeota archaeon]